MGRWQSSNAQQPLQAKKQYGPHHRGADIVQDNDPTTESYPRDGPNAELDPLPATEIKSACQAKDTRYYAPNNEHPKQSTTRPRFPAKFGGAERTSMRLPGKSLPSKSGHANGRALRRFACAKQGRPEAYQSRGSSCRSIMRKTTRWM